LKEEFKFIKMEKIDDNIMKVIMYRPERLNALNPTMRRELKRAFEILREDPNTRVVILTGTKTSEGKYVFSSGDDLYDSGIKFPIEIPQAWNAILETHEIYNMIYNFDKPVIAMVDGYCLGGGLELALACDIIVASEEAVFGMPEERLGIIPSWGGTQRLAERVGKSKAKLLIFTSRYISGKEAGEMGLADIVVPREKLEETVIALAREIAEKSPLITRLAKVCINRSIRGLDTGLSMELLAATLQFKTEDFNEAVKAFFEKRKPVFKGK